jgi:hypothetical protein
MAVKWGQHQFANGRWLSNNLSHGGWSWTNRVNFIPEIE